MKFTKTLLACASILAMGTGMTSCLNGGNSDMEYTQTLTGFFNAVFSSPYDEPTYYNGVGYQIKFNSTQLTADVTIDGLKLPSGTYSQLMFDDVKWSRPDYWNTISLTNVQPTSLTSTPIFDSFKIRILDRYVLGTVYAPLMQVQYSLMGGGEYVQSIPSGVICEGTTTITPENGNTITSNTQSSAYPTYAIQFIQSTSANLNNESERMAVLQMANFSFDNGSSTHTFIVKNLKFNVKYDGSATLSLDEESLQEASLTNTTNTTAYGDYKVTNLTGTANAQNEMYLHFTVSSEQDAKKYDVVISCVTPSTTTLQ